MSTHRKSVSKSAQSEIGGNKEREQLEKQIAAFLKSGGKIQKIPSAWSSGGESNEARQRPHIRQKSGAKK